MSLPIGCNTLASAHIKIKIYTSVTVEPSWTSNNEQLEGEQIVQGGEGGGGWGGLTINTTGVLWTSRTSSDTSRPHLLTRAHYVKSKYIPPAARVASCCTLSMTFIRVMAGVKVQISRQDLLLCPSMSAGWRRLCAATKWECLMKRTLDTNIRLFQRFSWLTRPDKDAACGFGCTI